MIWNWYYYRERPGFYFGPIFVWGSIERAIFSSDSKLIYLLARVEDHSTPRVDCRFTTSWQLKVYSVEKMAKVSELNNVVKGPSCSAEDTRSVVTTIPIKGIKDFPTNIAVSPDNKYFVVLDRAGTILSVPLTA